MPIFRLDKRFVFPDPDLADDNGLLAVGGDLQPERVIAAYKQGIFPWPCEGYPLMWHSPQERFVLDPQQLQVNRTLEKVLRHRTFEVRLDTAFHDVMLRCADTPRPGQDGTWITDEMLHSYKQLHQMGVAHSAESWRDGELVGGLYGIAIGRAFFGESMFALQANASKVAFATLVRQLARWQSRVGRYRRPMPHHRSPQRRPNLKVRPHACQRKGAPGLRRWRSAPLASPR